MAKALCVPWLYAQNAVQWNTPPSGYLYQNVVNWFGFPTPFSFSGHVSTPHYIVLAGSGAATITDGGVKCGAGDAFVLLEKGDYHLLIDSAAVRDAVIAQSEATRATITAKGDETKAALVTAQDVIAGQVNYHGQTAKVQEAEFFGGAVVLVAVLVGWFIGYKWVGGN